MTDRTRKRSQVVAERILASGPPGWGCFVEGAADEIEAFFNEAWKEAQAAIVSRLTARAELWCAREASTSLPLGERLLAKIRAEECEALLEAIDPASVKEEKC